MATSRPLPTGEHAADGYTLIELLVVLAIMGMLLAAAPALINAARPGLEIKVATRQLVLDLRAARAAAVAGNISTRVSVDAAAHSYEITPGGAVRRLPPGVPLDVRGPRGEQQGKQIDLTFYPDGSSSGGSIRVGPSGREHWIVDHWLTGRITVDE